MADNEEREGPVVHFPDDSLFADVHTEGDAGVPFFGRGMLPNDGPPTDAPAPASVDGHLGTSGPDDQMRGDTLSGLGPGLVREGPNEGKDEED